ncbi:hypothetical protein CTAYLR_000803 [Chrysophaeum taylorii]|uniref:Tubby C-terminal domain-containing protein n=1 Tax=Chrysophaeum taylorii TaxID=2483200 RepID=A0AAD7UPE8_9STRA|nr:hypothetical protein CTAYLR_000803 [Chrysophaeum taylorii]
MAAIFERTSSCDVCAFEDYESLESGLSREYIASELLTPTSSRRSKKVPREGAQDPWQLCRLLRPRKEEFRLCNEQGGKFMFSAKKIGGDFFISTYEDFEVSPRPKNTASNEGGATATSPKANFGAVLVPHGGTKGPLSYHLYLSRGATRPVEPSEADKPIIEVWPSSVWSAEQQVELRMLRIRIPTPLNETPAHYIHDCASPTSQRPSHPGFFKSNDVQSTIQLRNKLPKWNPQLGCLSLHFGRKRVKASSSKNFLVYTEDSLDDRTRLDSADEAVFQLGKLGSRTFSLDFRYPLSPLQAFAIALTAFNAKHSPNKTR